VIKVDYSTLVDSSLAGEIYTNLEMLAIDKHATLFVQSFSDEKIIWIVCRWQASSY